MPASRVNEHNDEFEQLAGLAALHVLDGDELVRFEQHADACARCRLMLRLDRETLRHLSLTAVPMDPSPNFKARLMHRAEAELAASATASAPRPEPIQTRPRPANVIPLWRRSPWATSLAAVLVLGLMTFGAFTYENQPVAAYELTGNVPGHAVVVVRRSGAVELDMNGLPDPDPGFLYEAWVIPQGGQPVAAGTTTRGQATLPLPGNVRGSTIAVTQEHTRVDAPTGAPLLATVVQS